MSFVMLTAMLSSCNNSSSSSTPVTPEVERNCVPESELNQAGIVGGEKVSIYDTDSKKVVMLYGRVDDEHSSICTATAIAPNVLLTAAHCIQKSNFAIFHIALSCESGFTPQKYLAETITAIKNKKWLENGKGLSNTANDVAIVILKHDIPSSYRVMKIADPSKIDYSQGKIRFLGYGVVDYEAGGSGILRKTSIDITDVKTDIANNIVEIDQSHGHGVCSGDSGGPSFVMVGNQEQILGVNSIVRASAEGRECTDGAAQTLAAGHIDWIKSELAKLGMNINL